jgi:four helix bundle protein
MGVFRFEDLEVWKLAKEQCDEIGTIIRRPEFQCDSPIRDGLNETTVSIVENISEGFEREGRKEFAQFTRIAKGSNGEGRALLYLAHGRGYLGQEEFSRLLNRNTRIGKMLRSLHEHLSRPRRLGP